MRTLCPNFDREDALETVLEVPIPEESFASNNKNTWQNMKSWIKPDRSPPSVNGPHNTEIQLLLGVVGAPLIPLPVSSDHSLNKNIKDHPIEEASKAKYIVQQYIAAVGGEKALNSINNMYAMGKVKMAASEFMNEESFSGKGMKMKNMKDGTGEMGGFLLWQKRPDLWSLELMVSGCKISAGSDGKVAWRQTPWHRQPNASCGPPRPLRRSLQGLDPRSTANLFSNSIYKDEKMINDEACFVLELETQSSALKARSSNNVDIIQHTIWGYFSQKTGLLVKLEDSQCLRIKGKDNVIWKTITESFIQDYRFIEAINIAYGGKTLVSLFRFNENSKHLRTRMEECGYGGKTLSSLFKSSENSEKHLKDFANGPKASEKHSWTRMEEVWSIEEVDFNVQGLSMDCFLPPSDLKREEEKYSFVQEKVKTGNAGLGFIARVNKPSKIGFSKVVAIDVDESNDVEWEKDL